MPEFYVNFASNLTFNIAILQGLIKRMCTNMSKYKNRHDIHNLILFNTCCSVTTNTINAANCFNIKNL